MWNLVVYENGVLEAEYDRYYVELKRVQKDPEFWADHLAGKIWGTPEVIDDLLSLAKRLKDPLRERARVHRRKHCRLLRE